MSVLENKILKKMFDSRRYEHDFLGNSERKRSHGKPKIRREDNIISHLKEVGYEDEWKALVQLG